MAQLQTFIQKAEAMWTFKDTKSGVSLNCSLFSPQVIFQHAWYVQCKYRVLTEKEIEQIIREKGEAMLALFYNDKAWYAKNYRDLRRYVEWCDKYHDSDYSVSTFSKMAQFIRAKIDERRVLGPVDEIVPLERTCRGLFKRLKPVIQRLAQWQGYSECGTSEARGPVDTLRRELDQAILLKINQDRDHHALSRAAKKRLSPEEHERVRNSLWTASGAGNDLVAMRQLVEHCLQNAAGRRGEDLRDIRFSMFHVEHLHQIQPAKLQVIGASIYDPKEKLTPVPTLLSWCRTKVREECPIAALAAYIVFINDIHGLPLLATIRSDIQDLEQLLDKVILSISSYELL